MWVDAIRKRDRGRKLSQEEMEAASPVRARLWVTVLRAWSDRGDHRPLTATLLGHRSSEQFYWRQLDNARVKIRDGQIMVLGWEDHGTNAKSPKPVVQVWWCDPVGEPCDDVEAAAKARFPPTLGRAKHALAVRNRIPAWVHETTPGAAAPE